MSITVLGLTLEGDVTLQDLLDALAEELGLAGLAECPGRGTCAWGADTLADGNAGDRGDTPMTRRKDLGEVLQDVWAGCYSGGWQGLCVAEAFAH